MIEACGHFHVLLLTGRLLKNGDELDPYISGKLSVPLPTYFICTREDRSSKSLSSLQAGEKVCDNLTYLGEQGLFEVDGLSIAYLSGTYDPLHAQPAHADYSAVDVKAEIDKVRHIQFRGVDILLTNEWPRGILSDLSAIPRGVSLLQQDTVGADIVSQFASALMPRYHVRLPVHALLLSR